MKYPLLDKRLSAIASLITINKVVADIGTDHGYLIANLAARNIISKGYACDINEGPLKSAKATLSKYNLCHKVEYILTNGLIGLSEKDIDEVIIAGMGGDLILNILENSGWSFFGKRLILQPMTKAEKLRFGLLNNGFKILKEKPVLEGRFVYTIIIAEYTGEKIKCSSLYSYLGEIPNSIEEDRDQYLKRIQNNISQKLLGIEKSSKPCEDTKEYTTILKEITSLLLKEN